MREAGPELVTLHLRRVPRLAVPAAVLRMAVDRRAVRGAAGVRFAKLLGTGDGGSFRARDADPRTWGLLASWADRASALAFERNSIQLHQVLATRTADDGSSGYPLRHDFGV